MGRVPKSPFYKKVMEVSRNRDFFHLYPFPITTYPTSSLKAATDRYIGKTPQTLVQCVTKITR